MRTPSIPGRSIRSLVRCRSRSEPWWTPNRPRASRWPHHDPATSEMVKHVDHNGGHHRTEAEEREIREAALDQTIEASFPASDPPSTNPNPDARDPREDVMPADGDADDDR
jgi:hypothetical protein